MKIYSKKAFAIGPGAQKGSTEVECFVTVPCAFQNMPEKYVNDPTFKLAVQCGDITVVGNRAQQVEIENEHPEAEVSHTAAMDEFEAFYEELKGMSKEDALKLGEKYNVSPKKDEKVGQFKKRLFEAYKLAAEEATEE